MKTISHKRLTELLEYDPITGIFRWRKTRTFKARIGSIAGSISSLGYRVIRIDDKRFFAHRLAWLYMFGKWPEKQIDHINLNKDDNKIANLREASPAQNQMNNGCRKNNTSGLKGVRQFKGKWRATIGIDSRILHLGTFEKKEDAYKAYCNAASSLHGDFARFE